MVFTSCVVVGRIGRVDSPLESKGGRGGCWNLSLAFAFSLVFEDFVLGLEDEASIMKLWGTSSSEESDWSCRE